MAGLGDTLSGLGNALFQHGMNIHKQDMLDKLEQDREKRADERTKAAEARAEKRDLAVVKDWKKEQRADGSWMEVGLNSAGDKITERAMDPSTIDDINFNRDKNKVTLDNLITTGAITKKNLENYDADKSLERQLTQARIGNENRQYTPDSKPVAFTAPGGESVKAAFGKTDRTGNTTIDSAEFSKFQAWRAKNPQITDGDQALVQYMGEKNSGEKTLKSNRPALTESDVNDLLSGRATLKDIEAYFGAAAAAELKRRYGDRVK